MEEQDLPDAAMTRDHGNCLHRLISDYVSQLVVEPPSTPSWREQGAKTKLPSHSKL